MDHENRQSVGGWYAPLEREERGDAANVKSKRRFPVGWRVALGVLLALGLIAGSSIFFSGREEEARAPSIAFEQPFFFPPEETGMPDDWRDYFDSFYIVDDSDRGDSRIPAVEERPAWQMELKPAEETEKSLQELYSDCVGSIVSISSYIDGETGYYWGSGIVLTEDGLILTNSHLIQGCDSARVMLSDNTEYLAELVGEDRTSDLAVLRIDAQGLTPAVFGESDSLSIGQRVAAIGNPLGEEFRATLTDGIISGIDRGINHDGSSMNLLQTNTAINEGSSGGALYNMFGQVVGVTNMKMMSNYSSIEGICFAIPSVTVRSVVNALIRDGKVLGRPAVGVTVGMISAEAAGHYDLPYGLYVSGVSEGSDASEKGIREGDIITAVNGSPARTSDDILRVRDGLSVGDTITFTIWRDGESFDVDVALMERNDIY